MLQVDILFQAFSKLIGRRHRNFSLIKPKELPDLSRDMEHRVSERENNNNDDPGGGLHAKSNLCYCSSKPPPSPRRSQKSAHRQLQHQHPDRSKLPQKTKTREEGPTEIDSEAARDENPDDVGEGAPAKSGESSPVGCSPGSCLLFLYSGHRAAGVFFRGQVQKFVHGGLI